VPKRTDIRKILLIGSGPIVIGQACEFDYSGTQACKALREEGFEVVLVNSNPATIMTDPEMADRTYIEPLTPEFVAKVIERERPQAMLPTVGGQTGLNLAVALAEDGTLDRFGVELIGAKLPAIRTAEDRNLFGAAMARIGLEMPKGFFATTAEEARAGVRAGRMGFPLIIRPSFTLGGTGGLAVGGAAVLARGPPRALLGQPLTPRQGAHLRGCTHDRPASPARWCPADHKPATRNRRPSPLRDMFRTARTILPVNDFQ